jgi:hypothetical protein
VSSTIDNRGVAGLNQWLGRGKCRQVQALIAVDQRGRPDQTLLDETDLIDDLRHFASGRRECWAIQYQVDI